MHPMKPILATLILFASAHALPVWAAEARAGKGSVEAGKEKSLACQACHGQDGAAKIDPQYPRLAGQYADYLSRALHEYRSGARKNPIMAGFATTLSDQDINDLAAFYASLPVTLADLSKPVVAHE
ncbi:Cytochrome c4 [Dokdonella koreensis DS-123]|uniref:Cytochrome c4 n=2 Tax=Dokdonella TaxID=323413 RepID=A0A160DUV4_9GAMM|nr:Cytochrome c4 [Dokdonella koreensis DS-123]